MHAPFSNKGFIPPAAGTAAAQSPQVLALREWPLAKETHVAQEHIPSQGSLYPVPGQRGAMQAQPFTQLEQLQKLSMGVASFFLCLTLSPPLCFHRCWFLSTNPRSEPACQGTQSVAAY